MKSFVLREPDVAPGFTEYYLNTELRFDSKIRRTVPIHATPRYKLHINLDDDNFVKHRDAIVGLIKQYGLDLGIKGFKFFNVSADSILEDDVYYSSEISVAVLEKIHAAMQCNPIGNTYKDHIKAALMLAHKIPEPVYKKTILNFINGGIFTVEEMRSLLNEADSNMKSVERYIGQAQFTIYLVDPIKPELIIQFYKLLAAELKKLNIMQGTLPNTDLAIETSSKSLSHLITFRQDKLDGTVDYVSGSLPGADEVIARLKDEASRCPLYQALVAACKNAEDVKTVVTSPSASASKIGHFSVAATPPAPTGSATVDPSPKTPSTKNP